MMIYDGNKCCKNYFSFFGSEQNIIEKSETFVSQEIDSEIRELSSRKLWQILRLNSVKGCELDIEFIEQVKQELMMRNDFDNGQAWCEPH